MTGPYLSLLDLVNAKCHAAEGEEHAAEADDGEAENHAVDGSIALAHVVNGNGASILLQGVRMKRRREHKTRAFS